MADTPALTEEQWQEAREWAAFYVTTDKLALDQTPRRRIVLLARALLDSERRYAEAIADTQRLDWLDTEKPNAMGGSRVSLFDWRDERGMQTAIASAYTFREAIDAARIASRAGSTRGEND